MAFTGDLEHLHIVDIIQLINTARKSGTFSVKSSRGESHLIFSNGYIVGASHLNNKVRIGTVLVKMNAITPKDLAEALEVQKRAGQNRKPLISTLIELGKLEITEASRGLRKLIEMTLVELVGWSKGTFTLDTDVIVVSPECNYPLSKMEQEISIDAQMILMDALRIFDELERDRNAGKPVSSDEELYADVIASVEASTSGQKNSPLTADDLGLGGLDLLERKIPQFSPVNEVFDPLEIHRQKIKETLDGFSPEEQETFASFLDKSAESRVGYESLPREESSTKGLVLFSDDELIKHSVMTICKGEGVLVFATDGEEELLHIIEQCLTIKVLPTLIFDTAEKPEGLLSLDKIISLRRQIRTLYPQVSIIQITSVAEYSFTLQSYRDGVRAVFPKPSIHIRNASFISDTIVLLSTLKSYMKDLLSEDKELRRLKERIASLQVLVEPSAVSLALLQIVSEICERAITFIVRPTELIGEKAIGVYDEKKAGPTAVTQLKLPLSAHSALQDVIRAGKPYFGKINDEIINRHLFEAIGEPLDPIIFLLPMMTQGKTVLLTYGDFGGIRPSPPQSDVLEILAGFAGMVFENALWRKQISKSSHEDVKPLQNYLP